MFFASDNAGPAAPEIVAAIATANQGYSLGYGQDTRTDAARAQIRKLFEAPEAIVEFAPTGTAANALILGCLAKPWDSVFCHADAHINVNESGATEFYSGGAKLTPLPGENGTIDPQALSDAMSAIRKGGPADTSCGPLSLTQATEFGSVYALDAIRELTRIAKSFGVPCHMDGARFANALAALGCSPAEMSWKAGIDALSFGGTKNGMIGAEAVIFFNSELARDLAHRRLRGGHMVSKQRFMAAQYAAYLDRGLWLELAARANRAAELLEHGLRAIPDVEIRNRRDVNILFAAWPRGAHRRARAAGAQYYLDDETRWDEGDDAAMLSARLVCNWATSEKDIGELLALIRGKAAKRRPQPAPAR